MLRLYDVIDRESMDDHFAREWKSFDAVTEGDLVGTRANGEPVLAPSSGRIVFPNVKSQPGTGGSTWRVPATDYLPNRPTCRCSADSSAPSRWS